MLLDNPRLRITIRDLRLSKMAKKPQRRALCQKEFENYLSAVAAMGEESVPASLTMELDRCLRRGKVNSGEANILPVLSKFVKWK